jgi:hypothetical protein
MEYFILIILAAASLQSAIKLTLLPRFFRYGIAVLTVLPVFFLEKRIAALNLQDITAYLNDGNHLIDLSTLVVIQELLALVIGISLVREVELGEKPRHWKYVALLPSMLMPVAALYLQTMAFNHLTRYSFGTLSWGVALSYAAAIVVLAELTAWIKNTRLKRTASALNASWLLLMLAVFLPVVATSQISGADGVEISLTGLAVLGGLIGAIALIAVITYVYKVFMEKRNKSWSGAASKIGWLLLLLVVFLPVAIISKIKNEAVFTHDLPVLGAIAGIVALITSVTYIYKIFMAKRSKI